MPAPWEQTWNDVKQGAEEVATDIKEKAFKAFPWLQDWSGNTQPSPPPQKPPVEAIKPSPTPLPNDPDGFWTGLKQKWHTEAPQRQAEIGAIKQKEFGADLPNAINDLEKALSVKGLDGTVRRILRTEYRDLTGREYNATKRGI